MECVEWTVVAGSIGTEIWTQTRMPITIQYSPGVLPEPVVKKKKINQSYTS